MGTKGAFRNHKSLCVNLSTRLHLALKLGMKMCTFTAPYTLVTYTTTTIPLSVVLPVLGKETNVVRNQNLDFIFI